MFAQLAPMTGSLVSFSAYGGPGAGVIDFTPTLAPLYWIGLGMFAVAVIGIVACRHLRDIQLRSRRRTLVVAAEPAQEAA